MGQGGRGSARGGEKPMGTAACGGRGFKGRAGVSGAAGCRQQHNQAPPPPASSGRRACGCWSKTILRW